MLAKIQKWGNTQGLSLTKTLLSEAQIQVGDKVDLSVKSGVIVVSPAKKIHGRYKLEDLIAQIPQNYQNSEVDWGQPVGKEVW